MRQKIYLIIFTVAIITSCGEDPELTPFVTEEEITIGEFLENNKEEYSMFYQLAEKAGVLEPLKLYNPFGNGGFTLFLPDNNAFDDYIADEGYTSFEAMLNDTEFLDSLAKSHIVASSYKSADFPYGNFSDSTFTGEYLYIGFDEDLNYRVNNTANIIQADIELYNGYIHIVDGFVEPNNISSLEYLLSSDEYSIISELFQLTGISDTMDVFRIDENGQKLRNYYTLLVETNEVFSRQDILNIDSLIARFATPGLEYTDVNNELYQFAAYHILEGSYAVNDFKDSKPYVTYSFNPINIDATSDIIINKGVPVFDTIVISGDSVALDYIRLNLYKSNGFSLNGPIHTLEDVLIIQEPSGTYEFQFYNEPIIFENKQNAAISPLELSDPSEMINLNWTGAESIYYLAGESTNAKNKDCLYAFGNFSLEYTTPNIAIGTYEIYLRIDKGAFAPQIKLYVDGIQQQSIVDLSLGKTGYRGIDFGKRTFNEFGSHTIKIETVIGGDLYWDWLRLDPI